MNIPSFYDFMRSIDIEKIKYDVSQFSAPELKENYNPFSKEEYALITNTNMAMIMAVLAQYHQWLSEQLP